MKAFTLKDLIFCTACISIAMAIIKFAVAAPGVLTSERGGWIFIAASVFSGALVGLGVGVLLDCPRRGLIIGLIAVVFTWAAILWMNH